MNPEIYKVTTLGKGAIYAMPKPSSENLASDVQFYREIGVTKVVSMLEYEEMERLGLGLERECCANEGVGFQSFPVKDHTIPSLESIREVVPGLLEDIQNGAHVSIHCKGGRGRTGVLSCAVLIESGMSAEDAIALVSEKRGSKVPSTEEQVGFLRKL